MDQFDQALNQRPDAAMFSTQISRSALSISVMSKKGNVRGSAQKYRRSNNAGGPSVQNTYNDLSQMNNYRATSSTALSGLLAGTRMLLNRGDQL